MSVPFEKKSLASSAGLHAFALLFALFGLPSLFPEKPDPEPFVMTIEIAPIGPMTNLPSKDTPIQTKKEAPTPVTKKPVTPAQETPKPAKPEPKKEAEPLPDPEKKIEEKKPEPKKEEPKKEEKNEKKSEEELAVLLNKLRQEAKTNKDAKDDTNAEENKTKSDLPYDDSLPLSISEKDFIRSQFIKCWRMPAGARDAQDLIVKVDVTVGLDGTVQTAELGSGQSGKYNSNPFFRAAADAAIRAVWKCSPLQNMPADKYGSWKEMELTFDPQELLF